MTTTHTIKLTDAEVKLLKTALAVTNMAILSNLSRIAGFPQSAAVYKLEIEDAEDLLSRLWQLVPAEIAAEL